MTFDLQHASKYNHEMETFTPFKSFTDHPDFGIKRETALKLVDTGSIDPPLRALVHEINKLEHVFTLQC